MFNKKILQTLIIVILSVLLTGSAVADVNERHAPRMRAGKDSASLNWGGYAVTAAKGAVSDVKGSWIVPEVTCDSTNKYSSFWVGIDGYSSNTVEQTGTDSDCSSGTAKYYAWYEFYPSPFFIINTINVAPGDVMSAEVKVSGKNRFIVTITDVSTGQTFSTSKTMPSARKSSAEWIAEAPSGGGILPLANFGTAYYGLDYTSIASTNFATISGSTGNINSFGTSVQQITMVSSSGATKAFPSSLSNDGTSFSMTWVSSGP